MNAWFKYKNYWIVPQSLSFFFVMPTSKHKYQCFLILVQSFSACTFEESIRWLFPTQTFISFVIHIPFKWSRQGAKTKQQQNKTTFTAKRSQECSPTNTSIRLAQFFFHFSSCHEQRRLKTSEKQGINNNQMSRFPLWNWQLVFDRGEGGACCLFFSFS